MLRKIICTSLSAVMAASLLGSYSAADTRAAQPMRDMTTMEIVNDMGIGINLGNTFDSSGD